MRKVLADDRALQDWLLKERVKLPGACMVHFGEYACMTLYGVTNLRYADKILSIDIAGLSAAETETQELSASYLENVISLYTTGRAGEE